MMLHIYFRFTLSYWIFVLLNLFCFCKRVDVPQGLLPQWMKHNLKTARSSTATCWNKHFSLDTCINSLLLLFEMKNAYFPFCLAFLERLVMNLDINLHSKTELFICICCLSYGYCPWWLTLEQPLLAGDFVNWFDPFWNHCHDTFFARCF